MCDKSPINIIQEYCVKKAIAANFEIITKLGGTHNNIFACVATCDNIRAEATAPNKKEAKRLAAIRLINQIPELSWFEKSDTNLQTKSDATSKEITNSVQPGVPTSVSSSYINALQEWCVKNNVPSAEYRTTNIGTVHQPRFETECQILSYSCRAAANNKKSAKHEAAKQMHSIVTGLSGEEAKKLNLDVDVEAMQLDIKRLEIPSYPDEKMIVETYTKLSKRNQSIGDDKLVATIHTSLKNRYNEEERFVVCQMLQDLIYQNNVKEDIMNIKKEFENILKRMHISVTYNDMSSMIDLEKSRGKTSIASVVLSTTPQFVEICCSDSYICAQNDAVLNLSKMLILILC